MMFSVCGVLYVELST